MKLLLDNYLINLLFNVSDNVDISHRLQVRDNVITKSKKYTIIQKDRFEDSYVFTIEKTNK